MKCLLTRVAVGNRSLVCLAFVWELVEKRHAWNYPDRNLQIRFSKGRQMSPNRYTKLCLLRQIKIHPRHYHKRDATRNRSSLCGKICINADLEILNHAQRLTPRVCVLCFSSLR